jgi:copper chaperone CopZ
MTQIQVENIKCNGCATSIKNNLLKIAHVDAVVVNIEDEIIQYEGLANKEDIINRLAEMGYPEKGSNNFTSKAKSFVSCASGKIQNAIN